MCEKPDAAALESEMHRAEREVVEAFKRWCDAKEGGITCWRTVDWLRGLQIAVLEE
jgi:hypothetical protein